MTIFKENIVDTSLIGPILTALLAAAGFYCKFWFTRYQAQKVSRTIEDVLSNMAALFGQKKPARILREEFSAVIAPLHQEMRSLDDMTSRLPLKWLQREQRHVLYHARWLQQYLDSRRGSSDGDFFLLLHDVAMGTDYQVADILASQHDCKRRRGSRGPLGKRKLSHAKTVFCTKRYRLYVMSGIFRIPA
ncbi:hypothetical protein [Enterobacter cloacae]|uniref:hypothetical protein n=1 Tax=Enterobacter cloacae TaxID=550 RepID=UPI001E389A2B|nr:hypothetical protein [Enterobacter cloacae]